MAQRTCSTCGHPLNRYNSGDRCGACSAAARDDLAHFDTDLPSPSYWFRPDVRRALGQWDWRTVFTAVHRDADLSQTRLAELVGVSQATISRLMSGSSRQPGIRTILGIVDGLGIPRLLAGLAPKGFDHLSPDERAEEVDQGATVSRVKRRDFGKATLSLALALPGMGATPAEPVDVTRLDPEQVTADLYALDFQYGGSTVVDLAQRRLAYLTRQLDNSSIPPSAETRVQRMIGELATCAGWAAYDAEQQPLARKLYRDALYAAHVSGDRVLRTRVLGYMSLQAFRLHQASESLDTAEAAIEAARRTTPRLQALMWMRMTSACAVANDATRYRNALRRAQKLTDGAPDDDAPTWFSFFDESEMLGLDAVGQMRLGKETGAKARFMQAAQRCTEVLERQRLYPRNRAYYAAMLAEAQSLAGDFGSAASTIHDELPVLAEVTSGRTLQRLRRVGKAIEGTSGPDVAECRDIIAGLTA